jgi:hypothetical protein
MVYDAYTEAVNQKNRTYYAKYMRIIINGLTTDQRCQYCTVYSMSLELLPIIALVVWDILYNLALLKRHL